MGDKSNSEIPIFGNQSPLEALLDLSKNYPDDIVVWCHESLKQHLNIGAIEGLFNHQKMLLSYNPSNESFLGSAIGYVEESIFIKINKEIAFPTWQMSGAAGAVHASVINALRDQIVADDSLDYFLVSLGKLAMPLGLFCYSEPKLLKPETAAKASYQPKSGNIFRFVKQHYKPVWVPLLLLNIVYYQKRFPLIAFLSALFYKRRTLNNSLDTIAIQAVKKYTDKKTVDVIIPTIGRKDFLYDVLSDLRAQTHLPSSVIIIEQNPLPRSESELDYLTAETWPFAIRHDFIHQSGACNSRNIGLDKITSEWVFLADDDIRFAPDFIQKAFENIDNMGAKAATFNCIQSADEIVGAAVSQWPFFGSGCSFVLAESIKGSRFLPGYEFGFGEDLDFGMQLRNKGCDVIYLPSPTILHLKAPIGGFRIKPIMQWNAEAIQPKPSPTIMLFKLLHNTKEQHDGYKTTLFFNYYSSQSLKNPISYYRNFKKQWRASIYWANQLKKAR